MKLNLTVPTCWQELTPKQLSYVYYLIAQKYSPTALQTYCLCRWGGLEIICPEGDGYSVRHDFHVHHINAEQLAAAVRKLDWLARIPSVPVRLSSISGHAAVSATLEGISFESYLVLENLYQGFLVTNNLEIFDSTTEILYGKALTLSDEERVSIFYWLSSVKQYFARRWPHFFKEATPGMQPTDLKEHLQEQMDTQIRALTKGDITKESIILSLDVHRALTELNAQAKEYEELKKEAHAH